VRGEGRRIEKIEAAVEPRFQEHFFEAIEVPHKMTDFTALEEVVVLLTVLF
jgi:uncharacterized 2Fe-2S/4Fe-4S cluster protein (DUF4445 family)